MKKLFCLILVLLLSFTAFGQSTIYFNNRVVGQVDAPVFDMSLSGPKLEGAGYWGQLWVATTNNPSSFSAVGDPVNFRTGLAAGYVNVGVDGSRTIPNVNYGEYAYMELRAWTDVAGVVGYHDVSNLALSTSDPNIRFGSSSPILIQTSLDALLPPPNMIGLQSFYIEAASIPEPPVVWLSGIGTLGLFFLFRRKPSQLV